jgi:hypothetical protein
MLFVIEKKAKKKKRGIGERNCKKRAVDREMVENEKMKCFLTLIRLLFMARTLTIDQMNAYSVEPLSRPSQNQHINKDISARREHIYYTTCL